MIAAWLRPFVSVAKEGGVCRWYLQVQSPAPLGPPVFGVFVNGCPAWGRRRVLCNGTPCEPRVVALRHEKRRDYVFRESAPSALTPQTSHTDECEAAPLRLARARRGRESENPSDMSPAAHDADADADAAGGAQLAERQRQRSLPSIGGTSQRCGLRTRQYVCSCMLQVQCTSTVELGLAVVQSA